MSTTNSINQQVIDFTANYVGMAPRDINDATILADIGIATKPDLVQYVTELEENFGLTYESGDENGINTVGDAVVLITNKMRN